MHITLMTHTTGETKKYANKNYILTRRLRQLKHSESTKTEKVTGQFQLSWMALRRLVRSV